jgi:hypothetical protein
MAGMVFFVSLSLQAQVNQDELEQNQGPVSFINYEGPQARIESRNQIHDIGYTLGQTVRGGNASPGTRGRYFVIHVTGPAEGDKLDADIFGLGYDTGVDHIRNLRLIVQGYLEGAYGYQVQDAALLAEYVTIYNAIYRGNWGYINSRYKGPVIRELDQDRAGLSIRFDEWPGRTLMLIPLGTGSFNSLSAVDTSTVADRQVVEELRRDDDRGIDQRRGMVDLKEREADEADQLAQEQRREAGREQGQLDQDRQRLDQDRRQDQQDDQGRPEQAAAGAGQEARDSRDQESREAELARRGEDLDRRQEAIDEKQDEARRNEEFAEQKRDEAREEREEIARDQQDLINQESRRSTGQGLFGAVIEAPNSPLGRIVRVLPGTGEELGRSAVNTVNTRTIYYLGGRLFAIAGENRGGGAIRLIEVDTETLEMKSQGSDDIHPQSLLWLNGTNLYALTVVNGTSYLGRFDLNLTRQARSTEAVHPLATVFFQEGQLLTQRQDGSALVLNPQTLGER